jgi:hypothetical protein
LRLLRLIIPFVLVTFVSSVFGYSGLEAVRLLPENIGKFRQAAIAPSSSPFQTEQLWDSDGASLPVAGQMAEYVGSRGSKAVVEIVRLRQDGQAYELFSLLSQRVSDKEFNSGIGTAGFSTPDEVVFFKGVHFVRIRNLKGNVANDLAQTLSESLDKGEGEIPALIKHLPDPDDARKNAVFLHSFADLKRLPLQSPVLPAIESGGNADAALATYGPSKVLIVEFNTPQLAADNDRRIVARIQELWKLGQPAPTAYRRVGNYSVFVFDAPDEQTAKQLIDQVKYEQVVQWLGENPNIFKEAERRYINTTLGVLIAVLKASGYALIACLGLGGLIGGLLFSYRRAQQKGVEAFSDAGGMLRLNLDELTPETDPGRLLRDQN